MTANELRASGGVTSASWDSLSSTSPDVGCWVLPLAGTDGQVLFNPADGRGDAIQFGPKMSTSHGIRVGSSVADLENAYPGQLDTSFALSDSWIVSVSTTTRYYVSADAGKVIGLVLGAVNQGCFG